MIRLQVYGHSDKGMKRSGNEDSFFCCAEDGIAIVADGMGGHSSGEVASALAVKIIREFVETEICNAACKNNDREVESEWLCQILARAISKANSVIFEKSASARDSASRMGTTITAFLNCKDAAAVAHVGDSRVYLHRQNKLFQLTQDHSLVNEQIRANLITAEEARTSVYRHIVTRALGMKDSVESDTQSVFLLHGDILLLCSDGLFDLVEDSIIKTVLDIHGDDLRESAHRLINIANERGGDDNISIAAVRIVIDSPDAKIKRQEEDQTEIFDVD